MLASSTQMVHALQEYVAKSQLGRSGFPAAFSLIFLSEIGDKTFFIAALLAAKFGRWLSFSASLLSLSVMTVISVAIGQSFRHVPEFMKSGLPIGEWASVGLLVYFGIRTIKVSLATCMFLGWWMSAARTDGLAELEAKDQVVDGIRVWHAQAGCLGHARGRGRRGAGGGAGLGRLSGGKRQDQRQVSLAGFRPGGDADLRGRVGRPVDAGHNRAGRLAVTSR
jgi:Uncharacterized protein family UPF0016